MASTDSPWPDLPEDRFPEGSTLPPPLLGARVKLGAVLDLLGPSPGDRIADLGCGGGKYAAWIASRGLRVVGVDRASRFLPEARRLVRFVQADVARLPIAAASMDKAMSVDVAEHLSPEALAGALREASRVLRLSGRLVVYTHTTERSPLAWATLPARRFVGWLGRRGIAGDPWDAARKAEHVNPVRTQDDFDALARSNGFEVVRRIYYNPILMTWIEELGLKLARAVLTRVRPARKEAGGGAAGEGVSERERGRRIAARRGLAYGIALVASWCLNLDIVLFGAVRAGPFFALLVKRGPARGESP